MFLNIISLSIILENEKTKEKERDNLSKIFEESSLLHQSSDDGKWSALGLRNAFTSIDGNFPALYHRRTMNYIAKQSYFIKIMHNFLLMNIGSKSALKNLTLLRKINHKT